MKAERARAAQGAIEPRPEQLDPVWELYRRAGRNTMYKEVEEDKVADLRCLVVKPFARFADSPSGRLAAWRRWEAWMEVNEPKLFVQTAGRRHGQVPVASRQGWPHGLESGVGSVALVGAEVRPGVEPQHSPGGRLSLEEAGPHHEAGGGHPVDDDPGAKGGS